MTNSSIHTKVKTINSEFNIHNLENAAKRILSGIDLSRDELLSLALESNNTEDLIFFAGKIRSSIKGNNVQLCSIVNAKSGKCTENCRFCSQSTYHKVNIDKYPLKKSEILVEESRKAGRTPAQHFGIVTSGKGVKNGAELESILKTIRQIKQEGHILPCASMGTLDKETALLFKNEGLTKYHHNLETSPDFFPKICTTHTFESRLETLSAAKEAGLELCSGGIFGLGETWADRIDLALILRDLDVNSVPLNFLVPIPGTPYENQPPLPPMEILKIIAIYRFALPKQDIKVCGGRSANLRDLQSWVFLAGANGIMIGNYLTTAGREIAIDIKMLDDLNMTTRYNV